MPTSTSTTMMNWRVVRGSVLTADDGDGGGAAICMDAEVWSRLPQDLIWEVVLRLPPAKHFQLQQVNSKWRKALTSAPFRRQLVAAAAAQAAAAGHGEQHPQHEQQGVVACMRMSSSKGSTAGVMKVDLASVVPSSFWECSGPCCQWRKCSSSKSYSVVAAAHGLVCISNHAAPHDPLGRGGAGEDDDDDGGGGGRDAWLPPTKYCVLNPVTRTCRMLPLLPYAFKPVGWLLPTRTAAAVYGYMTGDDGRRKDGAVHVATYDLTLPAAAAAGAAGGDRRRRNNNNRWELAAFQSGHGTLPRAVAMCGGETYWYRRTRVHVGTVPAAGRPGGGGQGRTRRLLEEVAVLDEPVADPEVLRMPPGSGGGVQLVAHRGAVYLVKWGDPGSRVRNRAEDGVMAVWRLARDRLEWEAVARLRVRDIVRLTGVRSNKWYHPVTRESTVQVTGASAVRELLCCHLTVNEARFVLGFNLDTPVVGGGGGGDWELVHREQAEARPYSTRLLSDVHRYHPFSTRLLSDVHHHQHDITEVSRLLELRLDLFLL